MDILNFALHVHTLCIRHGGSVTSWLRSPTRNKNVGGDQNSLHLYGLAVDVVFDDQVGKFQAMAYAKRAGLSMLDEETHVHFQAVAPYSIGT